MTTIFRGLVYKSTILYWLRYSHSHSHFHSHSHYYYYYYYYLTFLRGKERMLSKYKCLPSRTLPIHSAPVNCLHLSFNNFVSHNFI